MDFILSRQRLSTLEIKEPKEFHRSYTLNGEIWNSKFLPFMKKMGEQLGSDYQQFLTLGFDDLNTFGFWSFFEWYVLQYATHELGRRDETLCNHARYLLDNHALCQA